MTIDEIKQRWRDVIEARLPGRLILDAGHYKLRWLVDRYELVRLRADTDDAGEVNKHEAFVAFYPADYPEAYRESGSHVAGPHLFRLASFKEGDLWEVDFDERPHLPDGPRKLRLEGFVPAIDRDAIAAVQEAQARRDEEDAERLRADERKMWSQCVDEWEHVESIISGAK